MLNNPTLNNIKELKLFGIESAYRHQLDNPKTFDMNFDERLALLIEEERLYRENALQKRLLSKAKLRYRANVEDIDYSSSRGVAKAKFQEFASSEWVKRHNNCIITGATGTGKSWLACAVGSFACRLGLSTYYIKSSHLFEKLKIAHLTNNYLAMLNNLKKFELLIIDDWCMESFGERQALDVQDILEDRYLIKSTLITSQFPISKWHGIIGEPTLADAIVDRLIHNCIKLDLKGESLRAKVDKG